MTSLNQAYSYRNLLLRDDYGTALPSYSHRCDIGGGDGFEGIFDLIETTLVGEDGDMSIVTG